jgi:hypothetical protein
MLKRVRANQGLKALIGPFQFLPDELLNHLVAFGIKMNMINTRSGQ